MITLSQLSSSFHLRHSADVLVTAVLLFATTAGAQTTYYWDSNGATAGFGSTTGTWGTNAFWSTDAAGTSATSNASITTSDTVNFGTAALNYAHATVTGPSAAQGFLNMNFGAGQTTALTISGGTLNLAANSTITQSSTSANMTIGSVLQGSGSALTKTGPGALTLSAANTFTGGVTLSGNGALNLAHSSAAGTGTIFLKSTQASTNTTLGISGGISVANAIQIDSTTGRENIYGTGTGDNALTGGITITGAGSSFMSIFNNQSSGNLTISSGITGTGGFTGGFALRGSLAGNTGFFNGVVNTPASYLNINGATTWTLNTAGGNYTYLFLNNTGNARLGVNNAIATNGYVSWSSNSTTGALDLNGFNQSVAGLDANYAANGNNTVTNNGTVNSTLTLAGLSANRTFAGVIKDGATNTISLVMNSSGRTQTLNGDNTFSGSTTVGNGTLILGRNLALQNSALDTSGSGTITLASGITTPTLGGLSGSKNLSSVITGNYSLVTALTLNPGTGASNTYSGNITDGAAGMTLTKTGAGTQILTGNNTYTGATTITAGTLEIGSSGRLGGGSYSGNIINSGNFTYSGTNNQTLSGVLSGSGALIKSGTSALTLSGNNSFTGGVTLTGNGVLNLTHSSAAGTGTIFLKSTQTSFPTTLGISGGITVANAIEIDSTTGRETITSTGTGNNALTGGITVTGAGNTFMAISNEQSSGNVTISGGITATGNFTGGVGLRGSLAGNTGFVNGAVNTPGSSTYFGINGATTWTLNTAGSNYTIFNLVGTGNARLGVNNAIATNAYVSWSSNSTTGALDLNGFNQSVAGLDANYTANGNNTVTNNGTVNSTLTLAGLSANRTFAGVIKDGATNTISLVMNSSGRTQTLNGDNTFSGSTTVGNGTLILGRNLALQNSALDTSGSGTITLASGITTPTLGGLSGSKNLSSVITGNYSLVTALTLNPGTGVSNTYSGNITNGAAGMTLTKTGAGTQILSGANTYTGSTTINAGTLQLGSGSTTGSLSTSSAITNNGALVLNRSNAVVQGTDFSAASITGTGMLIQNSSSTTTLNNSTNSFSGGVWVQQGTLYADSIGNSGSASYLGSGTTIKLGNGSAGGTLRITGTGTETTDKVIDLSGTTGGGTITNESANITFTSNLAMSGSGAKTLSLGSSGSNTSTTNFNGLLSDANGTLSLRMNGSGNANFGLGNANNSFSGAVTLDGNTSGKTYTLSVAGLGNATANSYLGRNATINIGSTNGTNILKYNGSGETTDKVINLYGTIGSAGLDQSGTGLLKFTSNFTATGVGAKTLTLQGSTAGTGEVAGIIVDSSGGATSVQKAGSGTWTLSGNNTYTGQSLLNAGVTVVSTIGNFGQSSNLGQGTSGASVRMGSTTTTGTLAYTGSGNTSNRTFQVGSGNGTGGATLTNNGSGALVFTASAFNTADTSSVSGFSNRTLTLRGSNTGNNEIQGSIINNTNGMVSVTKNDAGTWILSGNNTYTGATTITAGTLVLNGTNSGSAITVNSGGTLTGSGTGGATTVNSGGKIGPGNSPGILTVGDLTLNSGGTYTWEMANATGSAGTGWDQLNATGLLTIGSNATSTFTIAITSSGAPANWNYATTNQTWDILDYGTISGFNASYFTLNSTAFGGDLTPDSSWSLTDTGSALRLTYNYTQNTPTYAGATGIWSTGFTPAISNSANAIFFGTGGTATNDIASATLSSIGSLTFDGTNSYTLEANSGSAGYNSASALAIGGTIVNNSAAVQTINLATSFAANQTINANTGSIVIGGNMAVASGATLTVVGSNNTTLSGVVSGLGGLTKNSSSALTLSGNNTYSGNTTIGQGKVLIGDNNAFGTGSVKLGISGVNATITIASTDSTARTISNALDTFAGNSWVTTFGESSGGTGNLSFTNSTGVSLGSTSRTFNVLNTTSLASSFSTVSGAIVKTGTGTLILTGGSTYNGSTTINAGTLQLGNGGTTGSLSAGSAITNNGTLVFNRSNTMTQGTAFSSAIGGTGHVIQAGSGTLVFSGANTYTGSTTVSAGNLTISNSSALGGTGSGTTVANGAALQIQGDIVVGAEALNLAGSGFSNAGALRNLSGTNSLAGAITLAGATTIGSDAGALTLSGGISGTQNLTLTGAGNTTISGAIATSTGTLTKNGSGTATLSAANTYSGSTTINAGTLNAAAANAAGSTSNIIINNGGSFLVTADDAIGTNTGIELNGGTLAFGAAGYDGNVGALTLSANSTIDLGTSSTGVFIRFHSINWSNANALLAIYNWTGTTQSQGGDGNNTDQVYFTNSTLSDSELQRISFYSDTGSSFVGNAFQITSGTYNREIIAVPEPQAYFTAAALLLSLGFFQLRVWKRKATPTGQPPA